MIKQLREAIRRSGRSLNQLGQECGVGPDRLSRFMQGKRTLTLPAAEKICRVLGYELVKQSKPRPTEQDG